jgi:hypothetical protein
VLYGLYCKEKRDVLFPYAQEKRQIDGTDEFKRSP